MSPALLEVFLELRRRGLPLGAPELVLAQRALAGGHGAASRAALVFACQTLWAKSRDEAQLVAEVLERWLPPRLAEEDIAALRRPGPAAAAARPPPAARPDLPAAPAPPAPRAATPAGTAPAASGRGAAQVGVLPPIRARRLDTSFDFSGEMPVTRRQLTRAWRYFRRMRRVGAATELDVPATLAQTYRHGVFVGALRVPRRSNQARLVLLEDCGGSMAPFARITRPLVDTALAGGFAAVAHYCFRNVPGEHLWLDRALARPVAFEAVAGPLARAAVLIVSDAGAARGHRDAERIAATRAALARLAGQAAHLAWINPMPRSRWPATSAADIARLAAMFSLDRAGLDAAVDVLRGRKVAA